MMKTSSFAALLPLLFGVSQLAHSQAVDQKPGVVGVFGTPYRIGIRTPLQIRVTKAYYDVTPLDNLNISDVLLRTEKVLVVELDVQNASERDLDFRYAALGVYVVDASGETRAWQRVIKLQADGAKGDNLRMTLRPAQRVACAVSIRVSAAGQATKLMIERGGEPTAPIIRYDLVGKAAPVEKLFSDPTDPHKVLEIVPIAWHEEALKKRAYPLCHWAVTLEKLEKVEPAQVGLRPKNGVVLYAASLRLKNLFLRASDLRIGRLTSNSFLKIGERTYPALHNYAAADIGANYSFVPISPFEETRARLVFEVPTADPDSPTAVRIGQGNPRESTRLYDFMLKPPAAP